VILGLAGAALAAEIAVVAPDGPLRPGVPARLAIAAVDELGIPASAPPTATAAVPVRPTEPISPGIYAYTVVPPADARVLAVTVEAFGDKRTVELPIVPFPASGLSLPPRIDAQTGDAEIAVMVTGDDLPSPADLQVVLGEGTVRAVDTVPGGLLVRVDPGELAQPRAIAIGVRDRRHEERPVWSWIRVRSRTTIELHTEPGATLNLTLGRRSYGPFVADAAGIVRPVIDQYPGELAAQIVLVDDIGNETRTTLALTSTAADTLVAMAEGDLIPGRAAPRVWLYALHGDGHGWDGAPPACQTPVNPAIPVLPTGAGTYLAALPDAASAQDVRLRCAIPGGPDVSARIPVGDGVPVSLDLRVWPDELSTGFPVAEVEAVLVDARGERLATNGLELWADAGHVDVTSAGGSVLRGEYDGKAAVGVGRDLLHARYDLPPGDGPPTFVVAGHGEVGRATTLHAWGRVLDPRGNPLVGVPVALSAGADAVVAVTGDDGWADAAVTVAPGLGPVAVSATAAGRVGTTLALRGGAAPGGPGSPDLVTQRPITLTAGRVDVVDVVVDPAILYTGPHALARVTVHVRDRAGAPIVTPPDEVTVTAGHIGEWTALDDGGYVADYTPPPGDQARAIDVTVRSESSSTKARITLEPRPIDRSVMLSLGLLSNFGAIFSPYLAADLDWRSPLFRRKVLLRVGAGWYDTVSTVDPGVGQDAQIRTVLLPVTIGLLARGDYQGDAFWGGLGAVATPYVETARFGADARSGVGIYPPGLAMIGGLGRRLGPGELCLEARATAQSSPGGEVGLSGPVGGVAFALGYRLIY
jgi:hypothetical protein